MVYDPASIEVESHDPRNVSMRQIVTGWRAKLEQGKEAKKDFTLIANQCMQFFCGKPGFMFEPEFQKTYTGNLQHEFPFQVTVNKAFEMVAVLGPHLFSQYPRRTVKARPLFPIPQELFGPQDDPNVQQMVQQVQMNQQMELARRESSAMLQEHYLNYTPQEQPGGGMQAACRLMVTEALLKGRGVALIEPYQMPGSEQILTRCVHVSVDDLLVDPDSPKQDEWSWIAIRHRKPAWKVERIFKLKKGVLRKMGSGTSSDAEAAMTQHGARGDLETNGDSKDLIEYWEIFSKQGVDPKKRCGDRLGFEDQLASKLDDSVGDYARIVVSPKVPWPLNMPPSRLQKADEEEVVRAFAWPIPFYKDHRWPVAMLDFYPHPNKPWPIAPMAPGLGELVAINLLTSIMLTMAHNGSRRIIAALQSAAEGLKNQFEQAGDLAVIQVKEVHQHIDRVMKFVEFPGVSRDLWEMRASLMHDFTMRTGLLEVLYAANPGGVASRSATDAKYKNDAAGIRPGYMANEVESFLSEQAQLERIAAYYAGVSAKDVIGFMGSDGAMLWDEMFANAPEDVALRDMECTVEAGGAKRPTHERDLAMLQEFFPAWSQLASQYAATTTDSGPLNAFFEKYFKALGQESRGMVFGPWAPPQQEGPSPVDQKMQMEMQKAQMEMEGIQLKGQIEQQKAQATLAKAQMDIQASQMSAQVDAARSAAELQASEQQSIMEQQTAVMKMLSDQQTHEQEMVQDQEVHEQEIMQSLAKSQLEMQLARQRAKTRPNPGVK